MAAAVPLRPPSEPEHRTAFSDGGGSGPAQQAKGAPTTLGVLIFIGSEVMMFAGLISAFLVSRAAASFWPPPNQPRLPIAITGLNTTLLLLSGVTMWKVVWSLRRHERRSALRWMVVTSLTWRCIPGRSGQRVGTPHPLRPYHDLQLIWRDVLPHRGRSRSSSFGGIGRALVRDSTALAGSI